MDLKDKVVVITGASKGLGKELASVLAAKGAKVITSSKGGDVAVVADVTKEQEMAALAADTAGKFGRIDIWINNAGIWIPHGPIEELDMGKVRGMMDVNVIGVMNGTKAALREMRSNGSGVIVNIISTSALSGRPTSSAYCASKFAEAGFTKSLQMEVAGSGISAIAVYPGGMKTNLFDEQHPEDFGKYMEPSFVAGKIVENLEKEEPEEEQIIRRPEVV